MVLPQQMKLKTKIWHSHRPARPFLRKQRIEETNIHHCALICPAFLRHDTSCLFHRWRVEFLTGGQCATHGRLMGNLWATRGQLMGNPYEPHGQRMGTHGQPVGNPWATHEQSMGSWVGYQNQPKGHPWATHDPPIDIPCLFHG